MNIEFQSNSKMAAESQKLAWFFHVANEKYATWDPHWHQVTDVYATFTDKDFRLGLNAALTTLGAIALLAGATVTK